MNRYAPRIFATALIALLAAAGGLGYWKSLHDQLPEGLSMGNGRLEATEVQIASKIPGRLAEVLVDEGDNVIRGQLLARIDTRTMEAQRSQAEAEVLRARENYAAAQASVQLRQSELLLASQELKRVREIFQRKFASQQLLDQQQARFDTANAAVVAARAQLAAIKAAIGAAEAQVAQLTSEIDDSSLRAPINGIIQLRLAEPGEVLGAAWPCADADRPQRPVHEPVPASVHQRPADCRRPGAHRARRPARARAAGQGGLCRSQGPVHPQTGGNPRRTAKAGVPGQTAPERPRRRAASQTRHARRRLCTHG